MRVLAIFSGRTGQIGELIAKQALLGAKDRGAEIELINLRQCHILACKHCGACYDARKAAVGRCPIPDDYHWIDEQIMRADGLIVVMPNFEKAPPSEFKALMDRSGPGHDVYARAMAKKVRMEHPERYDDQVVDERCFNKRFAAFISHGGSEWSHLGLPTMMGWCCSMGLVPVDKLLLEWNNDVLLRDDRMARIRDMGNRVAACCEQPEAEHPFFGEPGHCPICHNDVFVLGKKADEAVCTVCGVTGTLTIDAERNIRFQFTEEQLSRSHMLNSGRKRHFEDMGRCFQAIQKRDPAVYEAKRRELIKQIDCTMPPRG